MTPLNKQAFEYLKNLIANNSLKPDTIYSETKLSKELGISRTPFRDAIHRLAQEGYIDIIPSKGFQLHKLSAKDVWDTFQLRSAMECYCTVEISKLYTTEKARKLFRELHNLMDKSKSCFDDIESFLDYDLQFHLNIIEFFENAELTSTFKSYQYRMRRLASLTLQQPGRILDACQEHSEILQAMESGKTTQIYELTLKHMENTKKLSLETLEDKLT